MRSFNITINENELNLLVSALLFSSSVNVITNVNKKYFQSLMKLATKLKNHSPELKLKNVQFIKEENYEDELSIKLYDCFKENIEVVDFDKV